MAQPLLSVLPLELHGLNVTIYSIVSLSLLLLGSHNAFLYFEEGNTSSVLSSTPFNWRLRFYVRHVKLNFKLLHRQSNIDRLVCPPNLPYLTQLASSGYFSTQNDLVSLCSLSFTMAKQHTSLVGGSNPSCCPLCQKVCISGEDLMEHMKYVHKDPNASGVPGEVPSS